MKLSVRVIAALLAVIVFCGCASAALPSVTMLSTKTCPACSQMEKVLSELKAKYSGKIAAEHIYLEDKPEMAKQYNVVPP